MKLMTICYAAFEEVQFLRQGLQNRTISLDYIKDVPLVSRAEDGWKCLGKVEDKASDRVRYTSGGWYRPAVLIYWDEHMQALYAVEGEFFTGCSG